MSLQGTIIRGYSSFYYVQTEDGQVYECKQRGKFRQNKNVALVGDKVDISVNGAQGVIEEILPRTSELIRPAIANVNQVLVIFALDQPKPDLKLLDRILVLAEHQRVEPILCFNKVDLVNEADKEKMIEIYKPTGYPILVFSALNHTSFPELRPVLKGKITVLAGPSGAGKSTLLNALNSQWQLKTGDLSEKVKRGKHTTRYVELLPLGNSDFVADSPGFSTLYLPDILKEDLAHYMPDFVTHINCKFNGCLHLAEPQCGIKAACEKGLIAQSRYENYKEFMAELKEKERKY